MDALKKHPLRMIRAWKHYSAQQQNEGHAADELGYDLRAYPIEVFNLIKVPDYKDQSAQSKIVISTGIAEIQMPWMASAELILVLWIPAIPAGKTLLLTRLYNQVKVYLLGYGYRLSPLRQILRSGKQRRIVPDRRSERFKCQSPVQSRRRQR